MFKIFRYNCCGLDVHKTWIYACIGITGPNNITEYKQARFSSFTKGLKELCDWLAKYECSEVCMESTGKYWIPVFNILEQAGVSVVLAHPKYTKPRKGNKTDRKDAKWICDLFMCDMVRPSFIPPADIRQLRDLMRYRFKLTNMIVGEKNRARNCLTVSNLKLDDVFTDVFGKSARSITEHMLDHPGESFDVKPFLRKNCKSSVDEIQAAIDGAISKEQAIKLRECLSHIDELENHKSKIEQEILCLCKPYETILSQIRSVPGFDKNPMTAIGLLSEIGPDMSVFPSAKNLVSWAGCCPRNDSSAHKVKSTRISRSGTYLKPLLVQIANALVKSKNHPEFTERYRRIKSRRGHKKAIITLCRMILTAIWHMLTDGTFYTPDGFTADNSKPASKVLSTSQALALLKSHGYTIKDDTTKPAAVTS